MTLATRQETRPPLHEAHVSNSYSTNGSKKLLTAHDIPLERVFVERVDASTYAIDFGM